MTLGQVAGILAVMGFRCPKGCGSESFSAVRKGALVEDFAVVDGRLVPGDKYAEGGGGLTLRCDACGYCWRTTRDLSLAMFVEERAR